MRVIYADGFSRDEKLKFRAIVRDNAIRSVAMILQAMKNLGIVFEVLHCTQKLLCYSEYNWVIVLNCFITNKLISCKVLFCQRSQLKNEMITT